jgi:TolB protein
VLFGRSEQGVSCIYRVGLVGDQTRKLIHDAYEADMSPVDQRLAFLRTRGATSDPESVLVLARPDGSSERELYVGAYEYLFGVGWSPDGRSLAVSRAPWNNAVEGEVVVIDVDDGSVRVLRGRPAGIMPGPVAWSGAGDALIYAWNPGLRADMPVSKLVHHDVGTGAVTGLAWVSDMAAGLDSAGLDIVAPGTLVFAVESVTQNLAELSLVGGPRNLLTAGQSIDRQPVYSPDGSKVLYSSNRSGNLDLWIVDTATGAVRRLTDDASQDWDPAFTPDGDHVLWSGGRSGNLEIWMARVDGSGAHRITQDGVDAQNPTMSVDGEWIVYSTGNPAHPGIHAIRPDGTDDRRLSAQAATLPDVSPDGRHVAFLVPSAGGGQSATLQVADIRSGELVDFSIELAFHPSQVQLGGNYGRMRWLPDGSGIAFVALDEDGDWGVQAQDFVIGRDTSDTRRSLVDTGTEIVESFHLASDGSRAVVSMLRRVGSLMLAEQVPRVEPPRR